MVRLERGLVDKGVCEFEAGSRTERHSHRNRPVQLDHRRWRELGDRVVEGRDARPLGFRCGRGSCVARGDRRLQRVGAHRTGEPLGSLEGRQAATDEQTIPARPVLIEQKNGLAGGSDASTQT